MYVGRPDADVLFLGDMNVEYLTKSPDKNKLDNFLRLHYLTQMIENPTRVSIRSSLLIDHIYCNNENLYHHRGCIEPSLSDHVLTFVCRKKNKMSKEKKTVFIHCYRHVDNNAVTWDIASTDWSEVYVAKDVNQAVNISSFLFMSIVNKHMPFIKKSQDWTTALGL